MYTPYYYPTPSGMMPPILFPPPQPLNVVPEFVKEEEKVTPSSH